MGYLCLEAEKENLDAVLQPMLRDISFCGGTKKFQTIISIAVEEVFVNIANYSYEEKGMAEISWEITPERGFFVTFLDEGIPFNPLKKKEPDIHTPPQKRPPGGMGIFLVKKWMDGVSYEYKEGKNCFSM